jgi:cytochrome b
MQALQKGCQAVYETGASFLPLMGQPNFPSNDLSGLSIALWLRLTMATTEPPAVPSARPATAASTVASQTVRVWDLPTRVFHWLLAMAVVALVVTAKVGGNAMVWHFRLGYLVFGLLAFRVVWGFAGGHWSRFWNFLHAPSTTWRYLRGNANPHEHLDVGHNPAGSFSVFAMLGILAVQVASGLVADDDIANTGPLNRFVTDATAASATSWHKAFGQWLVIALVALHVLAVLYYLWRKRINLVRPMISGDKVLPAGTPGSADALPQRLLALVLGVLCAAFVTWVVRLGG